MDLPAEAETGAAINAELAALPPGETLTFPDKEFTLEVGLRITPTDNVLDFAGAQFLVKDSTVRTNAGLTIHLGNGIEASEFAVHGENEGEQATAANEAQHAVSIEGTANYDVHDFEARNVHGDNLWVGHGGPQGAPAMFGRVRNWLGTGSGRQGMTFTHFRSCVVQHFEDDTPGRSLIDIEPNPGNSGDGLVLLDGDLQPGHLNFLSSLGQGGLDNVWLIDLRIHGLTLPATKVNDQSLTDPNRGVRSNWLLKHVTAEGQAASKFPLMDFHRMHGLWIEDCELPCAPIRAMTAIQLESCDTVGIRRNTFPGAVAVYRDGSHPNTNVTEEDNTL